ncbi:MAG: 50S ribosomal protein L23 [Nitrospirota bacterium]
MKSIYEIIKKPLITEKGSKLKEDQNKIVLQVATEANKIEIKNAVETVFKVKVEEVRTMVFKGKKKRLGVRQGVRSDWKKAVVTLKEGQTVEYLEGVK